MSLGIDKCPYDIPRTQRTDDSVAQQNGVDIMTIESYLQMTSLSPYVPQSAEYSYFACGLS